MAENWSFKEFFTKVSLSLNLNPPKKQAGKILMEIALIYDFIVSKIKGKRRNHIIYSLIYIPAIIIFVLDCFTNLITTTPLKVAWGWSLQYSDNFLVGLSILWASIVLILKI